MKQMLDDLLDLARINEGRITLQRTLVEDSPDAAEMMAGALEMLGCDATNRGLPR
jgi:signal transduction histidine kinase